MSAIIRLYCFIVELTSGYSINLYCCSKDIDHFKEFLESCEDVVSYDLEDFYD